MIIMVEVKKQQNMASLMTAHYLHNLTINKKNVFV